MKCKPAIPLALILLCVAALAVVGLDLSGLDVNGHAAAWFEGTARAQGDGRLLFAPVLPSPKIDQSYYRDLAAAVDVVLEQPAAPDSLAVMRPVFDQKPIVQEIEQPEGIGAEPPSIYPSEEADDVEVPPAETPPPKEPEAPILKIKAPTTIDVGSLVTVQLEESGGPVREREIRFDPEIPPENIADTKDPTLIQFTGKPDVYTIQVLLIGAEKGFARQEVRIAIRDPRPPMPEMALNSTASLEDRLAKWVREVNVSGESLLVQAKLVGEAAHKTATDIRDGRASEAQAVDKWEENAYLLFGKINASLKPWTQTASGKSFFAYMAVVFKENAALSGHNQAKLLDILGSILEGKAPPPSTKGE